ncbi:MAG TPA: HAD-IIIA family hydrolase [Candidatus Acidoferrum sp.]|nr:HAD-IIIA family hydrolase [Candidatus Acidoferrum sp.]
MNQELTFAEKFLAEAAQVLAGLNVSNIEKAAQLLANVRANAGRVFILGVGGSAANASHAVNDFRKIAGIEAYAPTDNVSELTARTNDEGWATVFEAWLKTSKLQARDAVLVFSVGGGDLERNVSPNLVAALQLAKSRGAKILGVVGRDGGYTAKVADVCIVIPTVNPAHVTPHTEAFQAVVWHLLVTHPAVKIAQTRWEATANAGRLSRAVFLDRDGVLNRAVIRDGKPHPPANVADLDIVAGAENTLRELKAQGFKLLVVTNQPDLANGLATPEGVDAINQKLAAALPVDDFFVCPHVDGDNCDCRKPKAGLLLEAARRHQIDLSASFMIGDRWRDVEAGQNAGCRTVLIDQGYQEKHPARAPDAIVHSLREAADWILQAHSNGAAR